jgi:hypothetical protein
MHIVTLHESEITDLIKKGFVASYVRESIHYAIPQLSSTDRIQYIRQGIHMS